MNVRDWLGALVAALLLQAGVGGLWLANIPRDSGQPAAAGEQGVAVALGSQQGYAHLLQSAVAQPAAVARGESRPQPNPQPQPQSRPQAAPAAEPVPVTPVTASSLPEPRAATVQPASPLPATTPSESTPQPTPAAPSPVPSGEATATSATDTTTSAPGAAGARESAARQRGEGGHGHGRGGKGGKGKDYFRELMAWLNQYKQYPAEAKKAKQQGIVKLQFTIDSEGRLLAQDIRSGSGHPLLDRAALDMLQQASPLPPIPESMSRDTLTLVIPIEYSLITNDLFKE